MNFPEGGGPYGETKYSRNETSKNTNFTWSEMRLFQHVVIQRHCNVYLTQNTNNPEHVSQICLSVNQYLVTNFQPWGSQVKIKEMCTIA